MSYTYTYLHKEEHFYLGVQITRLGRLPLLKGLLNCGCYGIRIGPSRSSLSHMFGSMELWCDENDAMAVRRRWCDDDGVMAMKRYSIAPLLSRHRTIAILSDFFAFALFEENGNRINIVVFSCYVLSITNQTSFMLALNELDF